MKVVLIGATGFVGSAILNELIQRGHQVTAIARDPETVKQHSNVAAKNVNVLKAEEVAEVVKGHHAVISAYNPG